MINKDLCKLLARKKVIDILIWIWNDSRGVWPRRSHIFDPLIEVDSGPKDRKVVCKNS